MHRLAFFIHPIDSKREISHKYPRHKRLITEKLINFFCTFLPAFYLYEITGNNFYCFGKKVSGWLLTIPNKHQSLLELSVQIVFQKIVKIGQLPEKFRVNKLRLFTYTSLVGDGGITIANKKTTTVATGNVLNAFRVFEVLEAAAQKIGLNIHHSTIAVVGATGAISRLFAEFPTKITQELILLGLQKEKLHLLNNQLNSLGITTPVETSTSLPYLMKANLVLSETNATGINIMAEDLYTGSIICNLTIPLDDSTEVAILCKNVLDLDSGLIEVSGFGYFTIDIEIPPDTAYACMARAIALKHEGLWDDFLLGQKNSRDQVGEIREIKHKHGIKIGRFRLFERKVNKAQTATVKANVKYPVQVPVASL